jgi:hypothetical protein
VRWRRLFEDLEAQAAALDDEQLRTDVVDRTRAELAGVRLGGRLHSSIGGRVELRMRGHAAVRGVVGGWGRDWLLVDLDSGFEAGAPQGDEALVSTAAMVAVCRLGAQSSAAAGIGLVESRTPITAVLRAIARDRSVVTARLVDGSQIVGTPDRVGADWVDIAAHDIDDAPRASAVHGRWTVPVSALSTVWRAPSRWV